MLNFFELVMNENMKIYRRPRAWIMLGILALLVVFISAMALAVSNDPPTMWYMAGLETELLFMLAIIFGVIVAAGSVADEFATGTIKLLLIRPWSRSKILLSKYIANLMFGILLALVLFISSIVVNLLLFGYQDIPANEAFGTISSGSSLSYMLQFYGLSLIKLIMTITLAFMISTIFRSSALAIGVSIFLIVILNSFTFMIAMIDKPWVDYVLFIHLDLTQYLNGAPLREGMSYGFSLLILAIYYVLFIAVTWIIFKRRDVAS